MALLETMTTEGAIKHGVTVYPHVTEPKAQPLDVAQWKLSPWAKWAAADECGDVCEWEDRPYSGYCGWLCPTGQFNRVGTIDMAGIDWRKTLTPVPAQHSDWMQAHIAAEVAVIDAQPWCER